jgi:hypothetical protein
VLRLRARDDRQALTLALNLADRPLPLPGSGDAVEAEPSASGAAVAPHGWAVFST